MREAVEKVKLCRAEAAHGHTVCLQAFHFRDMDLKNRFSRKEIKCPQCHLCLAKPSALCWALTNDSSTASCWLFHFTSPTHTHTHPSTPASSLLFHSLPGRKTCVSRRTSMKWGALWVMVAQLGVNTNDSLAPCSPPSPTLLSAAYSSVYQTLMSSSHRKARLLVVALLWLHAQRQHLQTYASTRHMVGLMPSSRLSAVTQTQECLSFPFWLIA